MSDIRTTITDTIGTIPSGYERLLDRAVEAIEAREERIGHALVEFAVSQGMNRGDAQEKLIEITRSADPSPLVEVPEPDEPVRGVAGTTFDIGDQLRTSDDLRRLPVGSKIRCNYSVTERQHIATKNDDRTWTAVVVETGTGGFSGRVNSDMFSTNGHESWTVVSVGAETEQANVEAPVDTPSEDSIEARVARLEQLAARHLGASV